jgi:hypothetical protein
MKCVKHHVEAVAICACCGRALCADCITAPTARRITCSAECTSSLERAEKALELLLHKTVQNARATAFYYYLSGCLAAAAAVAAKFWLPSPLLIWLTAGCAAVLFLSGAWHTVIARKTKL